MSTMQLRILYCRDLLAGGPCISSKRKRSIPLDIHSSSPVRARAYCLFHKYVQNMYILSMSNEL